MGIGIIFIIVVIIIPMPTIVLDFLLMVNIGIALLILLSALYSREPLDMSLFPTTLLITTLFRLALNLSSTRLILANGFAGEVIETFGGFVSGGDIIVGIIVFIIIVIVNFMVITKGSERVAEVTARFTLDAMPGKQMAIDADLNSGLINESEAKARRKKIQDESNFYGAMDGASKFVKGDAIAGIIITFINIIGGIVLGVTVKGMELSDALNAYTIMTIGDGLVSQVPAILISVATGLLVTKATSDSEISSAFAKQIFSQPTVVYIAGGVLTFLGIFTPLPWYLFVPFGLLIVFAAHRMNRTAALESIMTEITAEDESVEEIRKPESAINLLGVDPIVLTFGYGLLPLVESSQGGDLIDRLVMIRRQIALDYGAMVPVIRVRDDIRVSPSEYRIQIKEVEIGGGEIMFDHYMAINPGYIEEEIDGIETFEPYMKHPALWISESQRERAEALGYTVVDAPSIIATHLTEVLKAHLFELLTRQDVQTIINHVKEQNSVLVEELIPKLLTIGEVQKVLANLLKEGISIRDIVTILETLADYAPVTRDPDMLTLYVRQALKRSISKKYLDSDINSVVTLDPELEQVIMDSVQQTEHGSYLALDPNTTQRIFDKLRAELNKLKSMGLQPIILTSPLVRVYFKRLVEQIEPDLIVLSYYEIEPAADVQSVGMVSIA